MRQLSELDHDRISQYQEGIGSQSVSLLLGIGSAIVAEITIYLLSLFLAHEFLENILAMLRLFGGIAHFSKFYPTGHSVEPNHF